MINYQCGLPNITINLDAGIEKRLLGEYSVFQTMSPPAKEQLDFEIANYILNKYGRITNHEWCFLQDKYKTAIPYKISGMTEHYEFVIRSLLLGSVLDTNGLMHRINTPSIDNGLIFSYIEAKDTWVRLTTGARNG